MAASVQSSFITSAAVFAGGLAVGVGGAIALSRSAFAPSTKLNKSTKDKARKSISLPSSGSLRSSSATDAAAPPASEQLDAVDAKGAGPASQGDPANKAITPVVRTTARTEYTGVTGKEFVPEPSASNRVSDLETKTDLSRPVPAHGDNVANDAAQVSAPPVWLTGLPESAQLSTSTGLIDKTAYLSSTALFVYESTTNGGLGSWSEREAREADAKGWFNGRPRVFSMQTRAGAGAAIAGYLAQKGASSAGTSLTSAKKIVSALTNADGFLTMAPSVAMIAPQSDSRLVMQVSSASQEREEVGNSYASVLSAASTLSKANDAFTVVLSADRAEAAEVAAACYAPGVTGNVAHVFDGAYAGREVGKLTAPVAVKPDTVDQGQPRTVVEALNAVGFSNFVYEGPASPKSLVVVPHGSHFTAARAVLAKVEKKKHVGLLSARIVRPWTNAEFVKLIASSVQSIHVVDEVRVSGSAGVLYENVQDSVKTGSKAKVHPFSLEAGESLTAGQWFQLFAAASTASPTSSLNLDAIKSTEPAAIAALRLVDTSAGRLATFVDQDASATSQTANLAARTFRERNTDMQSSRILSRYDNFEGGGVVRSDVILGSPATAERAAKIPLLSAAENGETQTLVIGDAASTLKGYNLFASLAPGGTVLINAPGWDGLELAAKLKAEDKRTLASKNARIYLLDATAAVETLLDATAKAKGGKDKVGRALPKETAAVVLLAAFLRLHLSASSAATKSLLSKILGTAPMGSEGLSGLVDSVDRGMHLVAFSTDEWKKSEAMSEAEANAAPRPTFFRYNGFSPSVDAAAVGLEPAPVRSTWALPAWQSMFSEAYNLDRTALRPDLDEQNWVLTVTENRRLTPADYDRNVFHLEFSTAGTGLKYEVGEALGIHGLNDEEEVRQFIQWSGYDADEIISVPSLGNPSRYETRTVFQILQQRLDIFGKPPKRFYEVLSQLAINKDEAKWLRFIGSPEGSSTFRKLAEVETVNYANVLQMFPSARLPLDLLMAEVEPIKPRHYSIASAQSFVGDVVHLLIVTVDWRTPSGSPRYGQCTRYLANLKVGEQVTVSLKPSVMKLPPFTTQPIVMSGLGTGAAPFRAYIQARAVQKQKGEKIGPLIYIFGSRYKHAEYLYGEELEAYERDGIVKVLTAFSRDQKNKIYIQHRIEQNQAEILDLLMPGKEAGEEKQGMFTLCGPTDPLPDVQEALIGGFMAKTGLSHKDGEAWLEALKEDERAVYEVY